MAQDLADGLVGAAVVALGAGLVGLESLQAAELELIEKLVIALATIAVFGGDGGDVIVETFPLHKHQEAAGGRVVGEHFERAGGTGELVGVGVEVKIRFHEREYRGGRKRCLTEYGTNTVAIRGWI